MCTVTAQYRGDGEWRVTMNRDEQRSRAAGECPLQWGQAAGHMIAPRDPVGGGTWVGVRPDGVWACLLNGYVPMVDGEQIDKPVTRGRIIPLVLASDHPLLTVEGEDFSHTDSFRLWVGVGDRITEYFWDRQTLAKTELPQQEWSFVTSSSYAQDVVKQKRRKVFEEWISAGVERDAHHVPLIHYEAMGVEATYAIPMARENARTQSCTHIDVQADQISMTYWDREAMGDAPIAQTVINRS